MGCRANRQTYSYEAAERTPQPRIASQLRSQFSPSYLLGQWLIG
jgi:hypothetical protein